MDLSRPLAIHAPGQADLNLYAYVHGKVLVAVDPVGLADSKTRLLVGPLIDILLGAAGVTTGLLSPLPGAKPLPK